MNATSPVVSIARLRPKYAQVPAQLCDHRELLRAAVPLNVSACGVYFLCRDHKGEAAEIVYVGQSVNVYSRVSAHSREGTKTFDSWSYVECHPEQLDLMESLYIHWLRPQFNGRTKATRGRMAGTAEEMSAPIPRKALEHLLNSLRPRKTAGIAA